MNLICTNGRSTTHLSDIYSHVGLRGKAVQSHKVTCFKE